MLPQGCVYTLVCASAMSELAKGRDLDQALELEPHDVADALGGLPEDHLHCARLAVNTLGEAIADYYRRASLPGFKRFRLDQRENAELGTRFRAPRSPSLRGESMLRIVLATARPEAMQAFAAALSSDPEVRLQQVASGAEALEAARTSAPHLVIIDADLPDTAPLDLVQKLLMVNAMVNTAVVSPLVGRGVPRGERRLGDSWPAAAGAR